MIPSGVITSTGWSSEVGYLRLIEIPKNNLSSQDLIPGTCTFWKYKIWENILSVFQICELLFSKEEKNNIQIRPFELNYFCESTDHSMEGFAWNVWERKELSKKWHYLLDQKLALKGFNCVLFLGNWLKQV